MFRICNMRVEDMETMAEMVALDHNDDPEKGYSARAASTG